jgi:hypothetical protein
MPSGGLVANHNRNQCITSTLGWRKFTVNTEPTGTAHSSTQGSTEARTSTAPDPQLRILEEWPPETPAEIQAIEQVSAELKLWRPRFLIGVINANDRISRVKPADTGQT